MSLIYVFSKQILIIDFIGRSIKNNFNSTKNRIKHIKLNSFFNFEISIK